MDYKIAVELILTTLPDTQAVYLFGSRAHDATHAGSDVDLAILAANPARRRRALRPSRAHRCATARGCRPRRLARRIDLEIVRAIIEQRIDELGKPLGGAAPTETLRSLPS